MSEAFRTAELSDIVDIIDDPKTTSIVCHGKRFDLVKHGNWIEREFGLMCSECGHYTEAMYDEPFNNEFGKGWAYIRPYYCGYCGAKMDENEWEEPEINPCRGCVDYDGRGGCKSNGGCGANMDEVKDERTT